jgi:hypothetical protein
MTVNKSGIIKNNTRHCMEVSAITQENMRAPGYKAYQKRIILNRKQVWVDTEFVPLLKAMNDAGLLTRSHCCGHDKNPAWVAIRMGNITGVEIRNQGKYKEILLTWKR